MIFKEKNNLSLLFLFPLLNSKNILDIYFGSTLFELGRDEAFINGYISDINRPHLYRNLFLLFEAKRARSINYDALEKITEFAGKKNIRIDGKFYVLFIYEIQPDKERDFELIKNGHYSKISEDSKSKIIEKWKLSKSSKLYNSLIAKDKELFEKIEDEFIAEEDYIEDITDQLFGHSNELE